MQSTASIQQWSDKKSSTVFINDLFYDFDEYAGLYALAIAEHHNPTNKPIKPPMPVMQLTAKGLALMSAIYAEKEKSNAQPLIISTVADFNYLMKLIISSSQDLTLAIIFQPTEGLMTNEGHPFSRFHKTTLHIYKIKNDLKIHMIDSTNNRQYVLAMYELITKAVNEKVIENDSDKIKFSFKSLYANLKILINTLKLHQEPTLDFLHAKYFCLADLPLVLSYENQLWLYSVDVLHQTPRRMKLVKVDQLEIFKALNFKDELQSQNASIAIYKYVTGLDLIYSQENIRRMGRQQDLFQCGIFAMKDARLIRKKLLDPFKQTEEDALLPPMYLKGVQREDKQNSVIARWGKVAINEKGETLEQVYQKHKLNYIHHFSQKYHDAVFKKFETFKASHPEKLRELIKAYDGGQITLERLDEVYASPLPAMKPYV